MVCMNECTDREEGGGVNDIDTKRERERERDFFRERYLSKYHTTAKNEDPAIMHPKKKKKAQTTDTTTYRKAERHFWYEDLVCT